jgi:hypothetical protein
MSQIVCRGIAQRGWLHDLPPVALLSGEDLAAIEALMEQGVTFVELLRRWRLAPEYAALPFGNFFDMSDDLKSKPTRRSEHQDVCWLELTAQIQGDLFPRPQKGGS